MVKGKVLSSTFAGTRARIKVLTGGQVLEALLEPGAADLYQEGDSIELCLPSEKLLGFSGGGMEQGE